MTEFLHISGCEERSSSAELLSFSAKPVHVEAYLEHCSSIEKNIDRRMAAGRFNLSILTALGAANGFILSTETPVTTDFQVRLQTGSAILALLVCIFWFFQILRFREVSRIKHEVAIELEKEIGILRVQRELDAFRQSKIFLEQTVSEIMLPVSVSAIVFWAVFF